MAEKRHSIHSESVYVVRETRSRRLIRCLLWVCLLLTTFVSLSLAIVFWQDAQSQQLHSINGDNFESKFVAANEKNTVLMQQKINAEMASDIDRQALNELRGQLVEWKEENQELRQKINFYRSLMEPQSNAKGLLLDDVKIIENETNQEIKLHAVVAQKSTNHQIVKGKFIIEVKGHKSELSGDNSEVSTVTLQSNTLPLRFRFFQQLEHRIELPEGSVPTSVRVYVQQGSTKSSVVERTLEWPF